jgi:uncharacterized protein
MLDSCRGKLTGKDCAALTLFTVILHANFFVLTFQYPLIFRCKSTIQFPRGLELETRDNRMVEVISFESGASRDVVLCHGSRVSLYVHKLICDRLAEDLRCNVMTFFFRGMNGRGGVQSERGIMRDVEAVAEYLNTRKNENVIIGQSLGCSVALHLATLVKTKGVILENPFTTFPSVLDSFFLLRLFKYLIVDEWNNFRRLEKVDAPVLFLVSENDSLVPSYHSHKLKAPRDQLTYLEGASHFNGYKNKNYTKYMSAFIESIRQEC